MIFFENISINEFIFIFVCCIYLFIIENIYKFYKQINLIEYILYSLLIINVLFIILFFFDELIFIIKW